MRTLVVILLFATPVFAQGSQGPAPCASLPNTSFNVKTDPTQMTLPQPDAGKALVYFLQDDSDFVTSPRPTTRFAVDGAWVGATHSNSYFYAYVAPGEHHLCAGWQPGAFLPEGGSSAAHFTAEPGGVYYFRVQNLALRDATRGNSMKMIGFDRLDSDEGQLLVNRFAFSDSSAKK
jgi:Protein of unknown function (DUF2846)